MNLSLPSVEIGREQNGRTQKANKHPVNSDILELVLENWLRSISVSVSSSDHLQNVLSLQMGKLRARGTRKEELDL